MGSSSSNIIGSDRLLSLPRPFGLPKFPPGLLGTTDKVWYGVNISDLTEIPGISVVSTFLLPPRQEGRIVLTGPNIDDNYIFWTLEKEKAESIDGILKLKGPKIRTVTRKSPPKPYQSKPIVKGTGDSEADEVLARELALFAINDADIYRQRIYPFIKNYARKKRRGVYDETRAVEGLANNLAKETQGQYWGLVLPTGPIPQMNRSTKMAFGRELLELIQESIDDEAGIDSSVTRVEILKDGKPIATVDDTGEAYKWLLNHQPQSVNYALEHGGYKIKVTTD